MNSQRVISSSRLIPGLFFFACVAAQATEQKPPEVIDRIMAEPIPNLSLTNADPRGSLRWVVWEEGSGESRTSHLALFTHEKATASSVWSTSWPDAWAPALQPAPEWRWRDRALLAVTLQFGAAAEQVELYGLDAQNKPVHLAEKTAASIGWKINTAGQRLLVLYEPETTVLKARCYGWQESTGKLVLQQCK